MLPRTTPNSSKQPPNGESALPQELIDIVIDHLHDDHRSLSACSTVCRTWLSPAQYHVFHTIVITCSLFRSSKKYHRLLACLDSSPHLATHVQHLKVDHTSWCIGLGEAEALLAALCSKLHNINTLTLQRVYIPALPDHLRDALCALFALPTLTQLSLIDFGVQTFMEFTTLLTTCSGLARLVLVQIRWEDRAGTEAPVAPSGAHCSSIRALKLRGVSYRTSRRLLHFLGAAVEDFELDDIFGHHRFEVDKAADFIALSRMPALRTLRLNPSQSALSSPGAWVVSLLASLPPANRVERVCIRCREVHLQSRPGALDWGWYGAVDETLAAAAAFPKLRRVEVRVVVVVVVGREEAHRGEGELRACFPRLGGRGILSACVDYREQGQGAPV